MWSALATAIATILGQIALRWLDNRTKAEDAVAEAANQTAKETGEIADVQARNNADAPRTADDVAARLRERLKASSGSNK
jgi:hypothetical protein